MASKLTGATMPISSPSLAAGAPTSRMLLPTNRGLRSPALRAVSAAADMDSAGHRRGVRREASVVSAARAQEDTIQGTLIYAINFTGFLAVPCTCCEIINELVSIFRLRVHLHGFQIYLFFAGRFHIN